MPTTLGEETKETIFLRAPHGTRLHVEFLAGAAIGKGQQVKLSADETVVPAAANEDAMNIIGVSMHDAESGEVFTVACKGYATLIAASAGVVPVGPVEAAAYDDTIGRPGFVTGGVPSLAKLAGWAITSSAGAGEEIWVIVA